MSGTTLSILKRTGYDFKKVLAADGSSLTVLVARRIDVTQWREGALILRVFNVNIGSSNDKIEVIAACDGYDPEYPSVDFDPVGSPFVQEEIPGDENAPYVVLEDLGSNFGGLIQVALMASRNNSSTQEDDFDIDLAIDLVLKD